MAGRVQAVCRVIADEYGNKADNIWKGVQSGDELIARLRALPGFGEQKAKIFAALLGKQLDVRPEGWRKVTTPYGKEGSSLSVADITEPREPGQGAGHQEGAEGEGQGEGGRRRGWRRRHQRGA